MISYYSDDLLKDIPGEWSDDDDDDMPNTSFGDHYEILVSNYHFVELKVIKQGAWYASLLHSYC